MLNNFVYFFRNLKWMMEIQVSNNLDISFRNISYCCLFIYMNDIRYILIASFKMWINWFHITSFEIKEFRVWTLFSILRTETGVKAGNGKGTYTTILSWIKKNEIARRVITSWHDKWRKKTQMKPMLNLNPPHCGPTLPLRTII